MAAPASLLANGDETVHRSRHRATHEQQVPLGIHLHDPEAELREAPRAHVTRHPFSFDDPGRIRPLGDGAGLAVAGVAVGLGAAAEMVAMHHTLEGPPLPDLAADHSVHPPRSPPLISTSPPAGKSSFVNASTVCERESRMSISRLCVLSSNCSRLFLSMSGLRSTVQSCRLVGSGIGPETWAPVFSAVRTMSAAAWSISAWSNAFKRIRILPAMAASIQPSAVSSQLTS